MGRLWTPVDIKKKIEQQPHKGPSVGQPKYADMGNFKYHRFRMSPNMPQLHVIRHVRILYTYCSIKTLFPLDRSIYQLQIKELCLIVYTSQCCLTTACCFSFEFKETDGFSLNSVKENKLMKIHNSKREDRRKQRTIYNMNDDSLY